MLNISRSASAFLIGLAIVGLGVSSPSGGDATLSAQAPNPCALVTSADIQPLAANETSVGEGVSSSLPSIGSVTCRYAWGAGVGRVKVDVVVNEAPRMFPGMSPDQIKQRLLESVKAGTADAVISDVGEVAVFRSDSPLYVSATAAVKGRIVDVHLDGLDAREKKDQVIALLKSAVSRL